MFPARKHSSFKQEQLELVRAMTRKMIDDDTFQMGNTALKDEQHALKARAAILEAILSRGEANDRAEIQGRSQAGIINIKTATSKQFTFVGNQVVKQLSPKLSPR
jgi:transcription elongation GreA/GreB family factor